MGELRILLTNEPRSYREAIAGAIRSIKPNTEVFVAGPEELDAKVKRLSPQPVICSHATPTVELRSLVWVELYPDHGSISPISSQPSIERRILLKRVEWAAEERNHGPDLAVACKLMGCCLTLLTVHR